jgi:uncharacterized membrane protein
MIFIYIGAILIYFTGISICVPDKSEDKIVSHRGVTSKDMRMSLLWPINEKFI